MNEKHNSEQRDREALIGFLSGLGLLFVILKLCKVIGWSWWWVTVPFWGFPAFLLGLSILAAIAGFFYYLIKG